MESLINEFDKVTQNAYYQNVERMEKMFKDIYVPMVGEDGNAFAIVNRVRQAVKKAYGREQADRVAKEMMKSESYDHLVGYVIANFKVVNEEEEEW